MDSVICNDPRTIYSCYNAICNISMICCGKGVLIKPLSIYIIWRVKINKGVLHILRNHSLNKAVNFFIIDYNLTPVRCYALNPLYY